MPYHVRITPKSDRSHDEVKLDLSKEQLEEHFLKPYREGRPITIGGRTITPDDTERIRINYTNETSDQLLPTIRKERESENVLALISDEWYVADRGKEVTDEFITGPPVAIALHGITHTPGIKDPRVVFVVHGRNLKARDAVFAFLRSLGLSPLEWAEAIQATGKASPYIGEILDTAFSIAQAIVVLMTPDDEARLREPFKVTGDPLYETELTPQARANVIFEAGMAIGRHLERTVLVELGKLRPFSDIGGRHVVRLDNSVRMRFEFAKRLQASGCLADLSGGQWRKAGDFDSVLK